MAQSEPYVPLEPVEPPPRPSSKVRALLTGRNSRGRSVMRDPLRLIGGHIMNPISALHLERREQGCARAALILSYLLELGASSPKKAAASDATVRATYQPCFPELSETFGSSA